MSNALSQAVPSQRAGRGVSALNGRHAGEVVYVVGTGPSMRVFPVELLAGQTMIGCNMAWKLAPVQYCVTIHPDLNIPEFMDGELPRPEITWVTKHDKARRLLTPDQFAQLEERFYYFDSHGRPNRAPAGEPQDSGRMLDWVRRSSGDNLYQWSSIAQTACNLAANMGARAIIAVGCDNAALDSNHHAHAQHTRWKGAAPEHRYRQYYEGLAEVRAALRERGIPLVSMTPFAALDRPVEDFQRLCRELGRDSILENPDISATKRRSPIKRLRAAVARLLAGR